MTKTCLWLFVALVAFVVVSHSPKKLMDLGMSYVNCSLCLPLKAFRRNRKW